MGLQIINKIQDISETEIISTLSDEKEIEKSEFHYTLFKYFARVTQFFAWPITFLYFNFFFKVKILGKENIRNSHSPFIIVSNHIAFYDSFILRHIVGSSINKLPLRFMAVNKFRTWYLNLLSRLFIVDFVYFLFGVFVVVKGRGIDKNIQEAIRIIKNGGNVVMYPEGSIMYSGKIEEFKLGAATLARNTSASVIPLAMKIKKGESIRREFIVNIGEEIKFDHNLSPKEITDIFYEKVKDLHSKE